MKMIPLLLVALSLSTPAFASSDADFVSALNDIQASIVRQAQAPKEDSKPKRGGKRQEKSKAPQAPAPALPAATDAEWAKIIENVKKDGKYKEGNFLSPARFTIEDVAGDPKGDRTMRGVTFLGMLNDDEKFEAMGAMIMVMEYKKDPATGNFNVDQWVFQTDVYGQIEDVGHATGVQGPDGKKISAAEDKLTPADPRIKTTFDAQTKFWSERSVK